MPKPAKSVSNGNGAVHPNSFYAAYARDPSYDKEGKPFTMRDGSIWWMIPRDTDRFKNALSTGQLKHWQVIKENHDKNETIRKENEELKEQGKPLKREEELPPEVAFDIIAYALAYGQVVKVEKMLNKDGSPFEYSEDALYEFLSDPYLRPAIRDAWEKGGEASSFWPSFIKDAEGNSVRT